jgi:hypothetical protein
MAIKKGAFELYTQERKLPDKKPSKSEKKSHFFEDVNYEIGSQSVQNRFTSEEKDQINISKNNTSNSIPIQKNEITTRNNIVESSEIRHEEVNYSSQSVHNRFTYRGVESKSNLNYEEDSLQNTNLQIGDEKKLTTNFSKIIGNQREIVIALYKNMRVNKSDSTEELTLEMISNLTGVNQKSLKNTLFRLTSSGVIWRADQKVGRGGWVKYQINMKIINEIQQYDLLTFSRIKK